MTFYNIMLHSILCQDCIFNDVKFYDLIFHDTTVYGIDNVPRASHE